MFLLSFGSTSSPRISFISCIRIMHSPFFIKLILFFNFCDIMLYYNNSHGQNEVNQVKKKTLVPLIIFLLGICLVSLIVYKTDAHEKEQRHITCLLYTSFHFKCRSAMLICINFNRSVMNPHNFPHHRKAKPHTSEFPAS